MSAAPEFRVLQVASEVFPLVKTGGLADVVGALPAALARRGLQVRLLIPGYGPVLDRIERSTTVAYFGPAFGAATIAVRLCQIAEIGVPVYVIDAPSLFDRPGNPYAGADGRDWPDNPQRFALLSWAAAYFGWSEIDRRWRPHVIHAHDWHAGLAPAYLAHSAAPAPAASVFTVHNLAFHGLFPRELMQDLHLPPALFALDGIEFHGQASSIKAGLQFADAITTVSPSYAREIQTREFGCGLEGVVAHRAARLRGILNGVDYAVWNPASDPAIVANYDAADPSGKTQVKATLQRELGLAQRPEAMLIGVVSRLTAQKGIDLLLKALPDLLKADVQLAMLGSGDAALEQAARALAQAYPGAVGLRFGYDEALAHRIIGGADVVAVPSRFEPCGLTQLYGLRYGTVPLVRQVGGLADTVVDATAGALHADTATGIGFELADVGSLRTALQRALELFNEEASWRQLMRRAMAQDFSWDKAALDYETLYRELAEQKAASGRAVAA